MILQGREAELKYLQNYYEKSGSQLLIIYGHRNIGKTALLLEFCSRRPHYYYMARNCSERQQQYEWSRELKEQAMELDAYPSYEEIFRSIFRPEDKKKILIIDEFQYLVKNSALFMKELIKLLHASEYTGGVLVLLCSSAIGWVENSMLSRLGRDAYEISGFLKIKEYKFDILRKHFPGYTLPQAVETYAVLGGIPGLWNYFEKSLTTKDNICKALLSQNSILAEAACGYVSGELRETSVYFTILAAIASGRHKLNELYIHTGFSRAKISVYLKNLMQLEIVEKVFSYDTPGRENTQKGIYRICNHLVYFYFKYIYPNLSILVYWDKEVFYDEYIRPTFREFVGTAYKKACCQYLEEQNQIQKLPFVYEKSGEWAGKMGNIDIIAQDSVNHTLVGYCSWTRSKMPYADYEWLIFNQEKARIEADWIYLFSETGFDDAIKDEARKNSNIHLIELASQI